MCQYCLYAWFLKQYLNVAYYYKYAPKIKNLQVLDI